MIDYKLRQRYSDQQNQKGIARDVLNEVVNVVDLKELNRKILEYLTQQDGESRNLIDKLGKAVAMIYKVIPRQINLPKVFQVKGQVDVSSPIEISNFEELAAYFGILDKRISQLATAVSNIPQPNKMEVAIAKSQSLDVSNLDELGKYFKSLEENVKKLSEKNIPAKTEDMGKYFASLDKNLSSLGASIGKIKIDVPKFDIPKLTSKPDLKLQSLLESLTEKLDKIGTAPGVDNEGMLTNLRSINTSLQAFVNRPTMTTPPVTNININPLQGLIKTTDNTVGAKLTQLPQYGQLFNRRAVQIYNNSANTIYIGGSDVTTGNGIPVPASSYSNIIDAGYNMIIYGIASQGGNDVRVMEVATASSGGVAIQE